MSSVRKLETRLAEGWLAAAAVDAGALAMLLIRWWGQPGRDWFAIDFGRAGVACKAINGV